MHKFPFLFGKMFFVRRRLRFLQKKFVLKKPLQFYIIKVKQKAPERVLFVRTGLKFFSCPPVHLTLTVKWIFCIL